MKAVILAAGYATRLYPLTKNTPKCLLTVGGRTILDSICREIEGAGSVDEIVIVTNAKFFKILSQWQSKTRLKIPVKVLNDGTVSNETRLGAIGDLNFALRQADIHSDILMMASDNLFEQDLKDFTVFAKKIGSNVAIAVYDLKDPKLGAKKFGIIEVDKSGKVLNIEEKPEHPRSSLIGMGVYYFPASSLGLVNEYLSGPDAQDAPGHYIKWLLSKTQIFSFEFKGMWYDIGDLKALDEANKTFCAKN